MVIGVGDRSRKEGYIHAPVRCTCDKGRGEN